MPATRWAAGSPSTSPAAAARSPSARFPPRAYGTPTRRGPGSCASWSGTSATRGGRGRCWGSSAAPRASAAGRLRKGVAYGDRVSRADFIALVDEALGGECVEDIALLTAELEPLDPPPCPITIAWAERDRVFPIDPYMKRAREVVPGAEFVVLDDVGHVPMLDDPRLVAETILGVPAPPRPRCSPRAWTGWDRPARVVRQPELRVDTRAAAGDLPQRPSRRGDRRGRAGAPGARLQRGRRSARPAAGHDLRGSRSRPRHPGRGHGGARHSP